jgi:hypothetical protein
MKGSWIIEFAEKPEHFVFDEDGSSIYCVCCDCDIKIHNRSNFKHHIETKTHTLLSIPPPPPKEKEEEEDNVVVVINKIMRKRTKEQAKKRVASEEFMIEFLSKPVGQELLKQRVLKKIKTTKRNV